MHVIKCQNQKKRRREIGKSLLHKENFLGLGGFVAAPDRGSVKLDLVNFEPLITLKFTIAVSNDSMGKG
jgi:hypothetical protein